MKEKEPGIAAALNLIPGLGYLYVNKKRTLGWILLGAVILLIISYFDPSWNEYIDTSTSEEWRIWDTISTLSSILFVVAFVVDGYQEAKKYNARIAKSK
jgi:hypothetical protein